MLNKEFLMAVGGDSEPTLSIYFTPGNRAQATVILSLPSGGEIRVTEQGAERKTFTYSEIDATAIFLVKYNQYLASITTKNLFNPFAKAKAPEVENLFLKITDVTQSASIVIT